MEVTFIRNRRMSVFTDGFFGFPIKIYDGFSLKKALEQEDKETTDEPVPIDWVLGWIKIPAREVGKLMWHDGFSRERNVADVAREGFDTTVVVSDMYGDFVCTWPRKKFESKLDEFMGKYDYPLPWPLKEDDSTLPPDSTGRVI